MAISSALTDQFPFLEKAPPAVLELLDRYGHIVTIQSGQYVGTEGSECPNMLFILGGSARVFKTGETGREITLYRLLPGDSCILTTSCVVSGENFPAHAVVEEAVEALVVPAGVFREWVANFPTWQRYVFQLMARRISTVIALIEEVTFKRMDARLATYLAEAARSSPELVMTHEAIAAELGTSREVVSRLLKDWERAGWIRLARGAVTILDRDALVSLRGP